MRHYKLALSLIAATVLAGCGGGSGGGAQINKVKFSSQVSFGDSLSDVGSYKVGNVLTLNGGQFNINGDGGGALTGKNWTQLTAAQFGLPAPCAAQTGLQGDASLGLNVAVVNHAECNGYAQGGARLFDPNGASHTGTLGQLTVPVVTQIQSYLAANNNAFKPDSIVFLLAGGNDIFAQLDSLRAGATAAGTAEGARVGGATFASTLAQSLAATATNPATAAQAIGLAIATENARPGHTDQTVVGAAVTAAATQPGNAAVASPAVYGPLVAAAQAAATTAGNNAGAAAGAAYVTANAPSSVAEMGRLGAAFGNLIKTQVVGKGANYVTVVNLPDVSSTPDALDASADQRALIKTMVITFNQQLRDAVASEPKILYVDAYTANVDQINNPAIHGLTNVTTRACDLSQAKNSLRSSLICTPSNLIAGDVSHYLFADGVHPTPYGYLLLARYVSKDLVTKGWL